LYIFIILFIIHIATFGFSVGYFSQLLQRENSRKNTKHLHCSKIAGFVGDWRNRMLCTGNRSKLSWFYCCVTYK